MKNNKFRILKAELDADFGILGELEEKYRKIHRKIAGIEPDEFDYAGLAYTIVNIYNLMENYLIRIVKCFENNIDQSEWHKDLLRHMSLDIDGIRPAFLTREDVNCLDDLRAFRHIFRHIYQNRLDIDKLLLVDRRVDDVVKFFKERHFKFNDFLIRLSEEMGKE